jgi:transcriptional regulator with XRE-family HTH domain
MNGQKVFFAGNIKFLRERKKLTQEAVAEKLSLTRSKLNALENGQTKSPQPEDYIKFSEYFKISIDSLMKVDLSKIGGLKLRELQAGNDVYMTGTNTRILAITVDRNNKENVEYVPVKAKAGYMSGGYNDPEFIAALPKFSLPGLPTHGTFRMFPTTGDSMLPIPENSRVIAKYLSDWYDIKPRTLCIVILVGNQDFVFKMVTVNRDSTILLESINTLFKPYMVQAEEVREIWKYYEHHTNVLPEPETEMQQLLRSMEEIKRKITQ